MTHAYVTQDANYLPPVFGQQAPVELDATWRVYDLGGIAFSNLPAEPLRESAFVEFTSDVAWFCAFAPTSAGSPSSTDRAAAGGTLAKSATGVMRVAAGERVRWRLARDSHRYVHLLGASAGTLRISVSSHHVTE